MFYEMLLCIPKLQILVWLGYLREIKMKIKQIVWLGHRGDGDGVAACEVVVWLTVLGGGGRGCLELRGFGMLVV